MICCVSDNAVAEPEPIRYKPVQIIYEKSEPIEKKQTGIELYRQYANLATVKRTISLTTSKPYQYSPSPPSSCSPSPAQQSRSIEEVKQQREILSIKEQPLDTSLSPTLRQRTILEILKTEV